jgi:hypothetical protein
VDFELPDPLSSRSLGLASMAEVLARANFDEKQPDAPSEATLVRDRERGPPAPLFRGLEEAFASDASASDVPCRHPGTVEATSGSLHRLARSVLPHDES